MTVDEIKDSVTMEEIARRYGVNVNRAKMCRCIFHQDKDASMKIYKASFHCFGCGADGDVFTFVQKALNCDFKTAFVELGGTYSHDKKEVGLAKYHAEKARETAGVRKEQQKKNERELYNELHESRDAIRAAEDDSDAMWDALERHSNAWLALQNMEGE